MGLHEELDAQPQPTGRHIIHLLADAIPQIQPQVLSFAARELQPKVVHFNYTQLSANLEGDKRKNGSRKWTLDKETQTGPETICLGESIKGRGHSKSFRQRKLYWVYKKFPFYSRTQTEWAPNTFGPFPYMELAWLDSQRGL